MLAGMIVALIALSTRAKELPERPASLVSVAEPVPTPPIEAPAPTAAQPAPKAVPSARSLASPEEPVRAAVSTVSTTGRAAPSVARTVPRAQAAAPAKLAGYRGGLRIDSDPDGARVFVDGEAVGFTPIQLKDLPVGSRVVRVEAEGYAAWTTAARVVANQSAQVTAVLQRSQR